MFLGQHGTIDLGKSHVESKAQKLKIYKVVMFRFFSKMDHIFKFDIAIYFKSIFTNFATYVQKHIKKSHSTFEWKFGHPCQRAKNVIQN